MISLNNKYFKNESGLTLIEVLLSITILGIVLTSFLSFFNQAYSYTKMNEDKTVGINVARNVLYYFEQQDFTSIEKLYLSGDNPPPVNLKKENCSDSVFDLDVCKGFFSTEINNTEFETEVTLQRHPKLAEYLIPVTVTVRWDEDKKSATVEGVIKK